MSTLTPDDKGLLSPLVAADPPGGTVIPWHVDDLPAFVIDAFGNTLGILHDPRYLQMLACRRDP